ncbi:transporter-like protein [Leptomonas pyrrhocoris]|uniref:Transporter-like protein n=1 Tax=Leptomonas pyrrhocoris TaxID=157538 RepID=A0A0M9GAP4_LEPPY|nr:transporter-like protein [Leptomonas pyrrhocoris]KPA86279.1 transporter-like protein [Leptomonas pyrrhocoris]|eukprot:XP_015664718.1 transporter-like protein [Leptomonas pyrrhocoris]
MSTHRKAYQRAPSSEEPQAPPSRMRKAKETPLPLSQMIPMTIVIMNESICGTMLMPFVGPFVAFLQGVPVNEAGYYSGVLIGVFMLGQVVSAKTWGRISDKYGRRFPIISGLFTSGLMMLGFGLSTNVWVCAVFRFFQGLFNGNVLVAKTMMADITDKTNQAGGFSFMSLCSAFGFLIGPTLGGLLYDPAHSKGLAWAKVDEKGFFGTHPAFLTSLVVFIYTNIGMLVCTFLVKESNPHAQPLPGFIRLVYPCLWYKSEPFVLPPIQYEDESEEEADVSAATDGSNSENRLSDHTDIASQGSADRGGYKGSREGRDSDTALSLPREAVVLTASDVTCMSPVYSPVEKDGPLRGGFDVAQEMSVVAEKPSTANAATASIAGQQKGAPCHELSPTSAAEKPVRARDDAEDGADETVVAVEVWSGARGANGEAASSLAIRPDTDDNAGNGSSHSTVTSEAVVTKFGYREAFACTYTRFMLSQYMVLSATDMIARDCFPLWAVATTSVGGLGLTSGQVSYILLANSAPCLMANLLFRIVERYFTDKMGLFRVGVVGAGTVVILLPFNSSLGSSFWVYLLVFLCTAGRQMFCSWCYSLNTMLTARSAPPGHVGSIMGINQSCGSLVRGIVPFAAAPVFAWSISGDHAYPFNHALVFFISSLMFYWCWWRSYSIRTDMDGNLQMVE